MLERYTKFYRIKGCGGPPPHQTFANGHTNQGKLCIILKGIYGRFRINLNNCEFTKFRNFASDFVSWSQKSHSGEIGRSFSFDKIL